MKPFSEMGDAELAAALRGIRPEPSSAFAAKLDQRVAAGFPRRSRQLPRNPFTRFFAWLRRGSRLRLLIPVGGVTIALVAIATAVVVRTNFSRVNVDASGSSAAGEITRMGGPGGSAEESEASAGAEAPQEVLHGSAGVREARPEAEVGEACAKGTAGCNAGGEFEGNFFEDGSAAGTSHRDVERGAEIVIGAKPGDVGEASSKVFETVHAVNGVVLNSSTRDGTGTHAEARFELLIPAARVGDAMAAFSRIGEVVDRHESTTDITAPTVGAGERLQDSEARINGLLAQLSEATTEPEREVVEAELDAERRHAARLKSKLSNLQRRASLSQVSVRIVSGKGALTSPAPSDGDWGVGQALGDAGHLLSVAAGVTIVGLAVLAPLLLLALLAWLAGRTWTRRARERALT